MQTITSVPREAIRSEILPSMASNRIIKEYSLKVFECTTFAPQDVVVGEPIKRPKGLLFLNVPQPFILLDCIAVKNEQKLIDDLSQIDVDSQSLTGRVLNNRGMFFSDHPFAMLSAFVDITDFHNEGGLYTVTDNRVHKNDEDNIREVLLAYCLVHSNPNVF